MKDKDKDIDDEFEIDEEDFGLIDSQIVKTSSVHRVYLTDSVTSITSYLKLLPVFDKAATGDQIILTLQNFGGSCHSCLSLINTIGASKAHTVARVIGPCYSAGTTLALACGELQLFPHTLLHFHDYSGTFSGKGGDIQKQILEDNKWIHAYMEAYHKPFLTDKEHKQVLDGKELYIHYSDKDIKARMKRHIGG